MTEEPGWEQFKRGVRRLTRAPVKPAVRPMPAAPPVTAAAPRPPVVPPAPATVKTTAAARPRPAITTVDDPQLLRRISEGKATIDATLDLHHHTEAAAHRAVLALLAEAKQRRWRILRIITGRGAVLRPLLPRWLAASPFIASIRWIALAAPRHGGDGAAYVVLRRESNQDK